MRVERNIEQQPCRCLCAVNHELGICQGTATRTLRIHVPSTGTSTLVQMCGACADATLAARGPQSPHAEV